MYSMSNVKKSIIYHIHITILYIYYNICILYIYICIKRPNKTEQTHTKKHTKKKHTVRRKTQLHSPTIQPSNSKQTEPTETPETPKHRRPLQLHHQEQELIFQTLQLSVGGHWHGTLRFSIWMFPRIRVGPTKSSHFDRVFHYKPSILVVFPLFLETPIFVQLTLDIQSYPLRFGVLGVFWGGLNIFSGVGMLGEGHNLTMDFPAHPLSEPVSHHLKGVFKYKILLMEEIQLTTWDVENCFTKYWGSTTCPSTGETLPDFWLPSVQYQNGCFLSLSLMVQQHFEKFQQDRFRRPNLSLLGTSSRGHDIMTPTQTCRGTIYYF